MSDFYLFICSDTETIDGKECAKNITITRLNKGLWPLYKGTKHRRSIEAGDNCLFYLAGRYEDGQHVIASGRVDGVEQWGVEKGVIDDVDVLSGVPEQVIHINNIKYLEPVSIRAHLQQLSFIPKESTHNWGGALQGGCKKLIEYDFRILSGEKLLSDKVNVE